jgi:cytochrome P450 family 135
MSTRVATSPSAEQVLPGLPPGPTQPQPLVAARFMLQPTRFLEDCARRFGDTFTVNLSAERTVVITSDPDTIKRVFTGDPTELLAGVGNVPLKPLLGPRSVLLLDGPEHLRQRRLMLPAFHGERMRTYGEAMRAAAERQVRRWPVGTSFPTQPSMQAITLDVILRAVFGVDDDRQAERMAAPLKAMLDATSSQLRLLLMQLTKSEGASPRSPWGRFRALVAPADAVVREQIATRRADPHAEERDDILSLLLAARDEDDQPLTDDELRDELMTLLLAGHETTATALTWTLERIVRHPGVLARLVAEQREGGDEYLDAVIKETLRLRPVVPAVARHLTVPFVVKDWELPAGVNVAPSIYLLHRRADLYPEPLAFRPERFLEQPAGTYEWIPFGGGIRRCLGASFALFEMKVVLSTILASVTLETSGTRDERTTRRAITFTPARGGRIALERA